MVVLVGGLSAHPHSTHVVKLRVIVQYYLCPERLLHLGYQFLLYLEVGRIAHRAVEVLFFLIPLRVQPELPASFPRAEHRVSGQSV